MPVKKYITLKYLHRKREGKKTDVVTDGCLWSLKRLQHETSRNDYTAAELMRNRKWF